MNLPPGVSEHGICRRPGEAVDSAPVESGYRNSHLVRMYSPATGATALCITGTDAGQTMTPSGACSTWLLLDPCISAVDFAYS